METKVRAHTSYSMPQLMSLEDMYKLTRNENTGWGIEGYEVPRIYQDPMKQIKDREYAKQQKGQKTNKYVTKRGHFLDDIAKKTKFVPGPQKYDVTYKWVDEKAKKERPRSAPENRNSFIDQIFLREKKRGNPGVGTYHIVKSVEEQKKRAEELSKKKIDYGPKLCYLSEFQFLSNTNPGPGQHNPRGILPKLKINNTKPDFWIKKHKDEGLKKMKSTLPDIGTYKPFPVHYETFGKALLNVEEKKTNDSKIKYWGSEARFKDIKKSKSKMILITPEPGRYELIAKWPGKSEGLKNEKKTNWMNRVTKGIQKSIYQ